MKLNDLCYCIFSILIITSCSKSPIDARKELAELDIPFEKETCRKHTLEQDEIAIDLFLASGISPECILMGASETGDIKLVQQALSKGADPNLMLDDESKEKENSIALCAAARQGHEEIVDVLLENGAAPDSHSDLFFGNCHSLAENRGHTEIAEKIEQATKTWYQENLVGLWSGHEKFINADDYWEIKRNEDGTFTRKTLSIDHKEKTYLSSSQVGEWKIEDKKYQEKILSNNDKDVSNSIPFEFVVLKFKSDEFQYNSDEGLPLARAKEEKIDKSKPLPSIPDGYVEAK